MTVDSAWARLDPWLRRVLRRRGVAHHLIDDIVQETAVRALAQHRIWESYGHLAGWCRTTSRNLVVDDFRRRRRLDLGILTEPTASDDPEVRALDRVRLAGLASKLNALPPCDLQLLLDAGPHASTSTVYVRRHRLRQGLAEA